MVDAPKGSCPWKKLAEGGGGSSGGMVLGGSGRSGSCPITHPCPFVGAYSGDATGRRTYMKSTTDV